MISYRITLGTVAYQPLGGLRLQTGFAQMGNGIGLAVRSFVNKLRGFSHLPAGLDWHDAAIAITNEREIDVFNAVDGSETPACGSNGCWSHARRLSRQERLRT